MEKIEKKDLKESEIYYSIATDFEGDVIFRYKQNGSINRLFLNRLTNNKWYSNNQCKITNNNFRLPTPEEKHWFLECEKANKYIPKEEALESFNKRSEFFVIGKWYKNIGSNEDYIGKFKQFNNGNFYATEYIYKEKYYYITGSCSLTSEYEKAIECSLEEIQKYLPENHPDKVYSIYTTKDPNYFKAGEYVILLSSCSGSNDWKHSMPENYCYILREDSNTNNFKVLKDIQDDMENGWSCFKGFESKLKLRHASKEEIIRYNILGKPYDITTLKLSGILEELKKEAISIGFTKGAKFKDLVHNKEFTVLNEEFIDFKGDGSQLYINVEYPNTVGNKTARIYDKGTWAAIISKSKEESKSLVGRYLKALKSLSNSKIRIGEYIQIINQDISGNTIWLKKFGVCGNNPLNKDYWELMPEGFEPPIETKEEWIPKIGDWIVITKSKLNWTSTMDYFDNKVVKITKVHFNNTIEFLGYNGYKWNYDQNHFRKALPNEIPLEDKSRGVVEKDTLLIEAKRRYPIGTKVRCVWNSVIVTIDNHYHYTQNTNKIWFCGKPDNALVYYNGVWAEEYGFDFTITEKSSTIKNNEEEVLIIKSSKNKKPKLFTINN